MDECKKAVVSLKQTTWEGILLDLLLFVLSSTIMDGGLIAIIMLFLIIAHWILSSAVLISQKARNSRAGKDFIRFGLFPLIFVTFIVRVILSFIGIGF